MMGGETTTTPTPMEEKPAKDSTSK